MNITSKYNIGDVVRYIYDHGGRDDVDKLRYGEIVEISLTASGMEYGVTYETNKFPSRIKESDIKIAYVKKE